MKKILVVDDEPDVRLMVRLTLEASKYYIIEAGDGLEALRRAISEQPDLIVLDVMMPIMDGFTVCQHLKSHPDLSSMKIILLTVKSSAQDRTQGRSAGADEYMTKPFSTTLLRSKVERLLVEQSR